LEAWDRDGRLSATYPYPVQVWRLGPDLTWVLLGGEMVVDYSLRLKEELGRPGTWVAGYTNDVMAYIPSRRVLDEGGYEGGGGDGLLRAAGAMVDGGGGADCEGGASVGEAGHAVAIPGGLLMSEREEG